MPPWAWIAEPATSRPPVAAAAAASAAASVRRAGSASAAHAAKYAVERALSVCRSIWAQRCATAWKDPTATPNCLRSLTYASVMSRARWQTPTTSADTAAWTRAAAPAPSGSPSPRIVANRRVGSIVVRGVVWGAGNRRAWSPSSRIATAAPSPSAASSAVPIPAVNSPEASPGSHRSRCSSFPHAWITAAATELDRNGVAAHA